MYFFNHMKKVLFTLLLSGFCRAQAQRQHIDSLEQLIAANKSDTVRIDLLRQLSFVFYNISLDSCLFFTEKEQQLAINNNDLLRAAKCEQDLGAIFEAKGNYPRALTSFLKALKQQETLKNEPGVANVLTQICNFYFEQDDPTRMLAYGKEAYNVSKPLHTEDFIAASLTLGFSYCELKQPGKAKPYFFEALQALANVTPQHSAYYSAYANSGLAIVDGLLGNYDKALPEYRKGIGYLITINDQNEVSYVYRYLSRLFKMKGQKDSSLIYAQKALGAAYSGDNSKQKLESYKLLASSYEGIDNAAAVTYFNKVTLITDSIHSADRNREVENLNFDEQERQQQLAEQAKKDAEIRKENLQLSAIALFIPLFLLILLWLSRTKTHRKVIEFMSVLSLLFVFEFITLLIHPWIEKLTNRIPILELIILVALAAILVPLHHRLTHWLKEKLVHDKVIPPTETEEG
jgi:tetratricopeptide (TPR) repeat protein